MAFGSAYDSAQDVFFVSRANQALLQKQCGLRLPNSKVVTNPLRINGDLRNPLPDDAKETRIACVARLDPRAKGQDVLFEVLSQPKWKERPLELNLYGSGPCEQSLRSLAAYFGVTKVTFQGQVADLATIWAANHALVLPSRFEGLPLAIVEAMLHSRLVITTAVAGNTEVVRDGVNGFVALAPTPVLFDDAMERAWSRRAEWEEIGLAARVDAIKFMPADPAGEFARKLSNSRRVGPNPWSRENLRFGNRGSVVQIIPK